MVVYPAGGKESENAVLWWPQGALAPSIVTLNVFVIEFEKTPVSDKMHGSFMRGGGEWENFVLTEDEYTD